MGPRTRKLALTIHVTLSVAWPGAVAAYLALALTSFTTPDPELVRGAYLAMDLTARIIIVPLALATLATGILMSLGTRWGLFRHYWTLISLLLTLFATIVLLLQLQDIATLAAAARDRTDDGLPGSGGQVFHAALGLVVLLVVLVLNMYKPKGLTRYGRRKRRDERAATG